MEKYSEDNEERGKLGCSDTSTYLKEQEEVGTDLLKRLKEILNNCFFDQLLYCAQNFTLWQSERRNVGIILGIGGKMF